MSNNSKMLLGVAPRRFGKSIAIAMLMAAGALVVYKLTEAVFATSQRISGNMGEYVKEAINMSGNAHRIVKFGEELILIQGDSPEDFRKINCYPANPKISLSIFFFLSFSFALMTLPYTHTQTSGKREGGEWVSFNFSLSARLGTVVIVPKGLFSQPNFYLFANEKKNTVSFYFYCFANGTKSNTGFLQVKHSFLCVSMQILHMSMCPHGKLNSSH